jgi:hypothetical protein
MFWQAETAFYFRMADGYISYVPSGLQDYLAARLLTADVGPSDWRLPYWLAKDQGATMIIVPADHVAQPAPGPNPANSWAHVLSRVITPKEFGGVYLFSLRPDGLSGCKSGGGNPSPGRSAARNR